MTSAHPDVVVGAAPSSERSNGLRHWHGVVFQVLALTLAASGVGCGDDKPPRDQAVFWMGFAPAAGNTCASARTFSRPDETARATITGEGGGARLVDGDDDALVECTVSGGNGQFNVSFNLSSGDIGNVGVNGTVTQSGETPGTGTLDVDFSTTDFLLVQRDCTATVEQAFPGALWVSNLSCPMLRDPNSTSGLCVGTGGFIIENCSR